MSTIHPTHLDGNPIQDLPLSALLQPASDIVKASGLESIRQIGFHHKKDFQFFFEFDAGRPTGEITLAVGRDLLERHDPVGALAVFRQLRIDAPAPLEPRLGLAR